MKNKSKKLQTIKSIPLFKIDPKIYGKEMKNLQKSPFPSSKTIDVEEKKAFKRVEYTNSFMDKSKRKNQEIPIELLRYAETALKEFASMEKKYEKWFSDKMVKVRGTPNSKSMDILSIPLPKTSVEIPRDNQEETVQANEEW